MSLTWRVLFYTLFYLPCVFPLQRMREETDSPIGNDPHREKAPKLRLEDKKIMDEMRFDLSDLPFETDLSDLLSQFENGHSMHALNRIDGTVSRPKPMIWYHMHKAGGTFMCIMAHIAGEHTPALNCNAVTDGWSKSGKRFKSKLTCEERVEIAEKFGYTWLAIEREPWQDDFECGQNFAYGTMMRDPIKLMNSFLNFIHTPNEKLFQELQDGIKYGPTKPWDFSVKPDAKFLDNFQVRSLSSSFDVPPGQINETHLRKAQQILDTKFDIVIRLEDLTTNRTITEFVAGLGWQPPMVSHIGEDSALGHRGHNQHNKTDLSQSEIKWLSELNKYDIELYNSQLPRFKKTQ